MAYIYEFLYRGKPDGSGSWHLIIADELDDTLEPGKKRHIERTMNIETATAEGWSLPTVLETINQNVLTTAEAQEAVIKEKDTKIGELEIEIDKLKKQK